MALHCRSVVARTCSIHSSFSYCLRPYSKTLSLISVRAQCKGRRPLPGGLLTLCVRFFYSLIAQCKGASPPPRAHVASAEQEGPAKDQARQAYTAYVTTHTHAHTHTHTNTTRTTDHSRHNNTFHCHFLLIQSGPQAPEAPTIPILLNPDSA